MSFELIAKTMQGLEELLAREITDLGGNDVRLGRRMVSFTGDQQLMYRANVNLRTALRILKPIATFKAQNPDQVYEAVRKIAWEDYFSISNTFSIETVVFSDLFRHSKFLAYRVKDGVADYFSEKFDKRPSVRITNPDIYINVHVAHETCTISLDSSGESLHKRGYRVDQTEAPLNEVLAAGMLLLAGWDGKQDFIDPMCGSGTLLIEAALIALGIPPGIYRKSFSFEKWKDYDAALFEDIIHDESSEIPFNHIIYGSDISPIAIAIAQRNIDNASLNKYIRLETKSIQRLEKAPEMGLLVTNPPYGERITTEDLLGLYESIGERLKHVFPGYAAWIISYREECFEKIGLRPSKRIPLMNGALDCEFRRYDIFEGKRSEFKSRQDKRFNR
jgi:putative N6-adenine-specific DNA methylase